MNLNNGTYKDNEPELDDSSEYIEEAAMPASLSFSTLTSDRFTNIRKIYSSQVNPTEIYSATRYGKRYILKGLNKNFRSDPIQLMALSKEFEIGITLDHPNIRRTIGFEEIEELGKVIILEYFDGMPLDEFIAAGNLTSYQARTIIEQLASALRYIHSKKIIHKDLKLSNILVSHHGLYVSLIDFNLSDSDAYIILKNPAGTRNYIAPELLESSASPSILTDIYSFGVIIRALADAANDAHLRKVSERCTATNPAARPQSVDELSLPKADASQPNMLSHFLSSKSTTYIFAILSAILAILVCGILYNRFLGI